MGRSWPTEEVGSITVEDALVDTGVSRLSLPKPIIEQLGLSEFTISRKITVENGERERDADCLFRR